MNDTENQINLKEKELLGYAKEIADLNTVISETLKDNIGLKNKLTDKNSQINTILKNIKEEQLECENLKKQFNN